MTILLSTLLATALQSGAAIADKPVRLDPTMPEPRLVKFARPAHPEEARKAGLQGMVVVECVVGADGKVTDASAVHGDPPLSDAAVKAVKKWRYEPLMLEGKRRPFARTVRINFVSEETLRLDELVQSLSSRYEAVRESAATVLGGLFGSGRKSREARWVKKELESLLEHEQSQRVRQAAQEALAQLATQ